jgi:hypothetical protein
VKSSDELRWTTERPAMSGVYLNAHEVEFEAVSVPAAAAGLKSVLLSGLAILASGIWSALAARLFAP